MFTSLLLGEVAEAVGQVAEAASDSYEVGAVV